jgi:methanogenic corrinoid protein MtbC1
MTFHLTRVREIVESVRAEGDDVRIPIMVGGYPFNLDDELWRKVGADGYAPDARSAVDVAAGLVSAD